MTTDNTTDLREIDRRIAEACRATNPSVALHALADELARSGTGQVDLYCAFSDRFIATDGSDPLYDILAEVLDRVYGGPWAKGSDLFPHPMTEADVEAARTRRR